MIKAKVAPNGKVTCGETGAHLGDLRDSVPRSLSEAEQLHLEIELPNFHCNVGGTDPTTGQQACLVCPRNLPGFRPDTDELDSVCDRLKPLIEKVSVLRFGGVAEPFWKSRIFDLLEVLGIDKDSDIKVFTTTNGTLLDEPAISRWFEAVPRSEMAFSVDATSLETYIKLRRIAEFDLVIQNIDHYCRTRNSDQHVAVLSNNINLINIGEVTQMVDLTKRHFFHFLNLSLTRPIGKELKAICLNPANKQQFLDARTAAQARATEIGVNVVFSGNWPD